MKLTKQTRSRSSSSPSLLYISTLRSFSSKLFLRFCHHISTFIKKHPKFIPYSLATLSFSFLIFLSYKIITTPRPPKIKANQKDSSYLYTAHNQQFSAQIGSRQDNTPEINFSLDQHSSLTFTPATSHNTNISTPQTNKKTITFKDVYPYTDFVYQTLPNGIKEEIVINYPNNIYQFPFYLDLNNIQPQYITENLSGTTFYDQQGKYLFHFQKPFAYDAAGHHTNDVNLLLKKDTNTQKMVAIISVKQDWLNDPNRQYPITIDPTIVHDESSDFSSGQFNRNTDTGSGSSPNIETSYQELPTDEHTVALYHLDETANNSCSGGEDACDSSGNGNHSTATGTTIDTSNQKLGDAARSFNGSSDYLALNTDIVSDSATNAYTVEAWINVDSLSSRNSIFDQSITDADVIHNYFEINTSGGISTFVRDGDSNSAGNQSDISTTADNIIKTGHWYHVAKIWDGQGGLFIYVDGQLAGSDFNSAVDGDIGGDAWIGRASDNSSYNYYFDGIIDEIRISNTARTPEEIKLAAQRRPYSIYTSDSIDLTSLTALDTLEWTELGVATGDGETLYSDTDLLAHWKFNETSGTTADNAEGTTDFDGTLSGFDSTASQDADPDSGWTSDHRRWGTGALMFDNTDSYINIGDVSAVDNATALSACAWVNHRTITDDDHILSKTDAADNWAGFMFVRDETGQETGRTDMYKIHVSDGGSSIYIEGATDSSKISQWTHVCFTYTANDSEGLHLYVNGQEDPNSPASTTGLTSIDANATNLVIGRYDPGTSNYFSGVMDSVSLYSRELTAPEVLANYNMGNIEFQTRTSADNSSWEAWKPTTNETQILSLDSDSSNWSWDGSATYLPNSKSDDSTILIEGSSSLKNEVGILQTDANTVGLWHLDETNGDLAGDDVFDSSSNNNDGEINGTSVTNGISGKARHFDGTDEYFSTSDLTGLSEGNAVHSIEAWIKPDATPTDRQWPLLLGDEGAGSHHWLWTSSEVFDIGVYGGNQCSVSPNIGQWNYIAATFDGNILTCYLNGQFVESNNATFNLSGPPLAVAIDYGGTEAYFEGSVDEVRISNIARTPKEIAENYRLGRDHYLSRTISSTDTSSSTTLPFYIAADRIGTYLQTTIGESEYETNQAGSNTLGLWHLDEHQSYVSSDHLTVEENGITKNYIDGNLTFHADQWNGGGNNGEFDITCTNGDDSCYFFDDNGGHNTTEINYGVACIDGNTGTGYLMYSATSVHTRFSANDPHNDNADNFIAVKYDSGSWYYDDNDNWHTFTPVSTDTLVAEVDFSNDTVSSLESYITLADVSDNANHGNSYQDLIQNTGKIGQSSYFDGTDDYIVIGDDSSLSLSSSTATFSISAWIYPESLPASDKAIFTKYDSSSSNMEYAFVAYNGELRIYINETGNSVNYVETTSGAGLLTDTWTYVTVTVDMANDIVRFYKNGYLLNDSVTSGSFPTDMSDLTEPARIGSMTCGSGSLCNFWSGNIDEVHFLDKLLTIEEIRNFYEIGLRTHSITIDFAASLDSGNLISGSGDTSFTIDATTEGLSAMGSMLFEEDKIIIKENYAGTEYIAQGDVTSVNQATGAVTVDAWDTGSTFPTSGFTANATVFKWQREYWPITSPLDEYLNATTELTLKITDGQQGRTIWLDDLKHNSSYLTDSTGASLTSTAQRYFQYRAIFTTSDTDVSPSLTSLTLNYTDNEAPTTPTFSSSYLHDKVKTTDTTPEIRFSTTDPDSDDLVYQIRYDTDSDFASATSKTSDTDAGFVNVDTPADTSPFNSGDTVSYTFQSALSNDTTYFYQVRAKDPSGANTYSSWSSTKSLTIDTDLTGGNAWFETHYDQFSTDTTDGNTKVDETGHYVYTTDTVEINDADTYTDWTSSNSTYLSVSQETSIKQEGTGSVKLSGDSFAGDGSDGDITISSDTSINATNSISARSCTDGGDAVNYSVTALTSNTATLESTPSSGCLSAGDEVLLINLRGTYTDYTNVGNYETLIIDSISTNTITFTANKTNYYGDGASDDTNIGLNNTDDQTVMLQRIPNYDDVTISGSGTEFYPDTWVAPDDSTDSGPGEGGILFFRATGTVSVGSGASIHANSKGYLANTPVVQGREGGEAFCGPGGSAGDNQVVAGAGGSGGSAGANGAAGYCGGGGGAGGGRTKTGGTGSASLGGAGGAGGEGDNAGIGASGGGGGYGTAGTGGQGYVNGEDGGTNTSGDGADSTSATDNAVGGGGGGTYGDSALDSLFFGASGGSGGARELAGAYGGRGGYGGGVIFIAADTLSVSGNITSDGEDGQIGYKLPIGAGGGGAGGSIKIIGNSLTLGSGLITASGGTGGDDTYDGGTGGSGRIAIYSPDSISGTTSPSYGTASSTSALNQTATYTSSALDLSGSDSITFYVRSTVTGQFARFQMGESSSDEQTYDITINSADTWEQKEWDISGITGTDIDAVTKFAFKIIDDPGEDFDFYFDDIITGGGTTGNTLLSTSITAANINDSASTYGHLTFTDDETNGDIKYSLYYDDSGTPTIISDSDLSGNSSGFDTANVDLSDLSTSTYPILYLYADLTYSSGSPQLQDWTLSFNKKPNTPTLDAPADTATNQSLTPALQTTATDDDSDYLRYKIELCTNEAMTDDCQTFDQTSTQTGWSGQDAESTTAYASGTQATYTVQTALDDSTTYYWRSYAIDPGGSNIWSDTQASVYSFTTSYPPTDPTGLLAEGESNPTKVTDKTPEFSAVCHDPDTDDMVKYRIQVDNNQDFSSPIWDSGSSGSSMTTCPDGDRSQDISYGGTDLPLDGNWYYWRIKFWDDKGAEGQWSLENSSFRMAFTPGAVSCRIQEATDDSSLTLLWTDLSSSESQYRIERNVNGGGFSYLTDASADDESYQDSDISSGNTYQYRVRAEDGDYSEWCITDTVDLSPGTINFQGLDLKGLEIR